MDPMFYASLWSNKWRRCDLLSKCGSCIINICNNNVIKQNKQNFKANLDKNNLEYSSAFCYMFYFSLFSELCTIHTDIVTLHP